MRLPISVVAETSIVASIEDFCTFCKVGGNLVKAALVKRGVGIHNRESAC